jgi:hypothetical protein
LFAYENNLMTGTSLSPMVFDADAPLTRGMLAAILYRFAGEPDISGLENPFEDIAEDDWYYGAVIWAAHNGITEGDGGGLFNPGQNITREQIAVMIYRYAQASGLTLPEISGGADFFDAEEISDWAHDAVSAVRRAGIISGKPGGFFDPSGNAARAEAAAILLRFASQLIVES